MSRTMLKSQIRKQSNTYCIFIIILMDIVHAEWSKLHNIDADVNGISQQIPVADIGDTLEETLNELISIIEYCIISITPFFSFNIRIIRYHDMPGTQWHLKRNDSILSNGISRSFFDLMRGVQQGRLIRPEHLNHVFTENFSICYPGICCQPWKVVERCCCVDSPDCVFETTVSEININQLMGRGIADCTTAKIIFFIALRNKAKYLLFIM